MEEKIYIKGSPYLPVRDAAGASKFTSDYVARLCRKGKVKGHRIGKNWYVDESSLKEFVAREENARSMRRERLAAEYARNRDQLAGPSKPVAEEPAVQSTASAETHSTMHDSLRTAMQKLNAPGIAAPFAPATFAHGVLSKASAAVFALCLMSAAWTFCAPPSARALAGDFLQNANATVQNALQSNPQQAAFALRNDAENIVTPINDAAVALGDVELNGAAQVGNVFTGYSSSLSGEQSEVDTQKLCVGTVCVTQQQFLAMVAAAGRSSDADGRGGEAAATSTQP